MNIPVCNLSLKEEGNTLPGGLVNTNCFAKIYLIHFNPNSGLVYATNVMYKFNSFSHWCHYQEMSETNRSTVEKNSLNPDISS